MNDGLTWRYRIRRWWYRYLPRSKGMQAGIVVRCERGHAHTLEFYQCQTCGGIYNIQQAQARHKGGTTHEE